MDVPIWESFGLGNLLDGGPQVSQYDDSPLKPINPKLSRKSHKSHQLPYVSAMVNRYETKPREIKVANKNVINRLADPVTGTDTTAALDPERQFARQEKMKIDILAAKKRKEKERILQQALRIKKNESFITTKKHSLLSGVLSKPTTSRIIQSEAITKERKSKKTRPRSASKSRVQSSIKNCDNRSGNKASSNRVKMCDQKQKEETISSSINHYYNELSNQNNDQTSVPWNSLWQQSLEDMSLEDQIDIDDAIDINKNTEAAIRAEEVGSSVPMNPVTPPLPLLAQTISHPKPREPAPITMKSNDCGKNSFVKKELNKSEGKESSETSGRDNRKSNHRNDHNRKKIQVSTRTHNPTPLRSETTISPPKQVIHMFDQSPSKNSLSPIVDSSVLIISDEELEARVERDKERRKLRKMAQQQNMIKGIDYTPNPISASSIGLGSYHLQTESENVSLLPPVPPSLVDTCDMNQSNLDHKTSGRLGEHLDATTYSRSRSRRRSSSRSRGRSSNKENNKYDIEKKEIQQQTSDGKNEEEGGRERRRKSSRNRRRRSLSKKKSGRSDQVTKPGSFAWGSNRNAFTEEKLKEKKVGIRLSALKKETKHKVKKTNPVLKEFNASLLANKTAIEEAEQFLREVKLRKHKHHQSILLNVAGMMHQPDHRGMDRQSRRYTTTSSLSSSSSSSSSSTNVMNHQNVPPSTRTLPPINNIQNNKLEDVNKSKSLAVGKEEEKKKSTIFDRPKSKAEILMEKSNEKLLKKKKEDEEIARRLKVLKEKEEKLEAEIEKENQNSFFITQTYNNDDDEDISLHSVESQNNEPQSSFFLTQQTGEEKQEDEDDEKKKTSLFTNNLRTQVQLVQNDEGVQIDPPLKNISGTGPWTEENSGSNSALSSKPRSSLSLNEPERGKYQRKESES